MAGEVNILSGAGAIAALAMSIFNYLKARKGAILELGPLVEIGGMLSFSPQTREEHLLLYLPLHFFNKGSAAAMITDVKMYAQGPEGPVPMYLMKRVQGHTVEEIESLLPTFPVYVKAGEGLVQTFEWMDGTETALKLDNTYDITITVNYDLTHSISRTYTLKLMRDEIEKFPKLNWIHIYRQELGAPPPIVFGKDLKRGQ